MQEIIITYMNIQMVQSQFFTDILIFIYVEGVTLVLPSRLFMFNEYRRILALS
jgi:hypothetical protein